MLAIAALVLAWPPWVEGTRVAELRFFGPKLGEYARGLFKVSPATAERMLGTADRSTPTTDGRFNDWPEAWRKRLGQVTEVARSPSSTVFVASGVSLEDPRFRNIDVAVKEISAGNRGGSSEASREIHAVRLLDGPEFVTFIEVTDPSRLAYGKPVLIMMEQADGDLATDIVPKHQDISKGVKLQILVVLLRALAKMSRMGLVHRDVKPANILVFGDCAQEGGCRVKLADFGLTCTFIGEGSSSTPCLGSPGSPMFMAPEALVSGSPGPERDVWGAGLVFYEMLFGEMPPEMVATRARCEAMSRPEDPDTARCWRQAVEEFNFFQDRNYKALWEEDVWTAVVLQFMLRQDKAERITAEKALELATAVAERKGVPIPDEDDPVVRA